MSSPGPGKGNKRKSKGRGGTGRGRGRQQLPSAPGRSEAVAKLPDKTSADEEKLVEANCASSTAATHASFSDSNAQFEEENELAVGYSSPKSKASPTPTASINAKETSSTAEGRETLGSCPPSKANKSVKSTQQQSSLQAGKKGKPPSLFPSTREGETILPLQAQAVAGATIADTAAAAAASERDVDKFTIKFGSSLTTEENTARQTQENIRPPKRPDYGTEGERIKLRANFFPIKISPRLSELYNYDVKITSSRRTEKREKREKREVVSEIIRKYKDTTFQGHAPAFDGENNLYSRVRLPLGNGQGAAELSVKLSGEDGGKDRVFKVKIQFAGQVNLDELQQFLDGKGNGKAPQNAIQALDIIMRQIPSLHFMPVGRSFFPIYDGFACPLGEGCEVRFGFYQSVRHSEWKVPLLNIDVSAKGFSKTQPVTELVSEIFRLKPGELENPKPRKYHWDKFVQVIKGLHVETNHLPYKRKYTVWGVTKDSADKQQFEVTDQKTGRKSRLTVAEYFKETYKKQLRYAHLPCLTAGPKKDRYLPMDVCTVIPCPKKHLTEEQTSNMIRKTARPAPIREQDVNEWVNKYVESSADYLKKEFGISVDSKMVKVDGRVLRAPQLNLGLQDEVLTPQKGGWDLRGKHLHSAARLSVWTAACFALEPNEHSDGLLRKFFKALTSMSCREGMKMAEPVEWKYFRSSHEVEGSFREWLRKFPNLQLVMVIVPVKNNKDIYAEVKRVGDNVFGIPTQCVKIKQIEEAKPQVCANLSMKINAKLGGVNHVIHPTVRSLVFKQPVIIFGADVTHPSRDENGIPSIAAVVASMDTNATKYYARVRAQKHEKSGGAQEIINDLAVMVKELLVDFYKETKGLKPKRIIFYRDGVSEGQFEQVLVHEVRAVQEACEMLDKEYHPQITFIVVQKRHHTRLFCEDSRDASGKDQNVPPGTTVDRGITHPYEFDFYLCSHFGIKGTSRPTHYHVLYDENSFTADGLQKLTYQLCHVYARCPRSVSMPAPAFYAHLVAFRARYHVNRGRESETIDLEESTKAIEVNDKMKKTMYFT